MLFQLYPLFIILVPLILILYITTIEVSSFVRQAIEDPLYDLSETSMIISDERRDDCLDSSSPTIDMKEVNYVSNGRALNATVWFTGPIENTPFVRDTIDSSDTRIYYAILLMNTSFNNLQDFVQQLLTDLEKSEQIKLVKIKPIREEKYEIILNFYLRTQIYKMVMISTIHNNSIFAKVFQLPNYVEFPMIEKIINSTEFMDYNISDTVRYENPMYGIRMEYPSIFHSTLTFPPFTFKDVDSAEESLEPLISNESGALTSIDTNPIIWFNTKAMNYPPESFERQQVSQGLHAYYYMLIDVSSVYDRGVDYALQYQWNTTSQEWDKMLLETSSSGGKLLEVENNASLYDESKHGLVGESDNYIDFSLNLSQINIPDEFRIRFGSGAINEIGCELEDVTSLLPIPPPIYSMNPIINHPIILNPNDEETLEMEIRSESQIESVVQLASINTSQFTVTVSPNIIYLTPDGKDISKVKITTTDANLGTQTVRIFANVTFPQSTELNLTGIKRIYSNPVGYSIPLESNLTLTVEQPPPWYQGPLDAFSNLSNPLTIIATAVTIISGILGLNFWKKNRGK